MRRFLTILMTAILFIVNFGVCAAASPLDGVVPLWDNVTDVSGFITFNSQTDTGTVDISLVCESNVTKISATATLYYQNERGRWVKTSTAWNYSVNSDELAINETFAAESGKTYRVLLSASVYVGDTKEAVLEEFIGKY